MATVSGTSANDVLNGTNSADLIQGFGGDDELYGNGGNDTLVGGTGVDYLYGGNGNDILNGGLGVDGGGGNYGGAGDDIMRGADWNVGGAGNDLIDGTDGSGDDWEWVVYSEDGGTLGVIVNLSTTSHTFNGVTVGAGKARDTYGTTDTLISIEGVLGTAKADAIYTGITTGPWYDDWIGVSGLQGADFIDGSAGHAWLRYEQEQSYGSTQGVIANLSSVTKSGIGAGKVRDGFGTIDTVSSILAVSGTKYADSFYGGSSEQEVFIGFAGNDFIDGGVGHDVAGYYNDARVNDWVGQPGDPIGDKPVFVNLSGKAAVLGGKTVAARSAIDGFGNTDTLMRIEEVWGTVLNDHMLAAATDTTFWGNAGDDQLRGAIGDDILYGDSGKDTLRGFAGNDLIEGGDDNDRIYGGSGNDTLEGGLGRDNFYFDSVLDGTANVDTIEDFASGKDKLFLSTSIFNSAGPKGALNAAAFVTGTEATSTSHRIIFNDTTGELHYDADGAGGLTKILFAITHLNTTLIASDLLLY